jgi:hypothetical protein
LRLSRRSLAAVPMHRWNHRSSPSAAGPTYHGATGARRPPRAAPQLGPCPLRPLNGAPPARHGPWDTPDILLRLVANRRREGALSQRDTLLWVCTTGLERTQPNRGIFDCRVSCWQYRFQIPLEISLGGHLSGFTNLWGLCEPI